MKKFLIYMIATLMSSQCCFSLTSIEDILNQHSSHETSIFSVIGALVFVIALIYITGIIYSKLNVLNSSLAKKTKKSEKEDKVIVLSSTPLGNNKSLSVVEVNGKKMLIGITQTTVTVLKDLGEVRYSNDEFNFEPEIIEEDEDKEINETKAGLDEIFSSKDVIINDNDDEDDDFGLYKKYL